MIGYARHVWIVIASVLVGSLGPASAQTSGDFFKNKQITIYVGSTAGGGYDTYARLIQHYLSKHTPGNPTVIVQNMPGAGSNLAANYVYNVAPKDGTAIAALQSGAPLEPLIGKIPVQHDPSKSQYLVSANNDVYVCVAPKDAPVQKFEDLFTKQLLVGASQNSSTSDFPAVLNAALGTKFKIITGYPGSNEIGLAVDKKEVQGACGLAWPSISVTKPGWFGPNGTMRVLAQTHLEGHSDLNKMGVPKAMSYAKTDEDREMLKIFFSEEVFGRPYVVPPEVPKGRVDVLRQAFIETLHDPELQADADKMHFEVNPVPGEEVAKLVAEAYRAPKAITEKIKAALNGAY